MQSPRTKALSPAARPGVKRDLKNVRTRYEPPTLDDAIYAAEGLSADVDAQAQIAARLTGLPEGEVKAALLRARHQSSRRTSVRIAGSPRPVTVERRGFRASGQK